MPNPTIENYIKLQLIKMNLVEPKDYSTIQLSPRTTGDDRYDCSGRYWRFKAYYESSIIICYIIDIKHNRYEDWFYKYNYDDCEHLSYFEKGSQRLMMFADFM